MQYQEPDYDIPFETDNPRVPEPTPSVGATITPYAIPEKDFSRTIRPIEIYDDPELTNPEYLAGIEELNSYLDAQLTLEYKEKLALLPVDNLMAIEVNLASSVLQTQAFVEVDYLSQEEKDEFKRHVAIVNAIDEFREKGVLDYKLSIPDLEYDPKIYEELRFYPIVAEPEPTPEPSPERTPVELATEDTRLYVPMWEKDEAKEKGARWNSDEMYWYAPKGTDLTPFETWRYSYDELFTQAHIDNFSAFLKETGVNVPPDEIIADGQWHAIIDKTDLMFLQADNPQIQTYRLDISDLSSVQGAYLNHRGDIHTEYNSHLFYEPPKGNIYSLRYIPPVDISARIAEQEAEDKIVYDHVAKICQAIVSVAPKAVDAKTLHPYLAKKELTGEGCFLVPDQKDLPAWLQEKVDISPTTYQTKQKVFQNKAILEQYEDKLDEHKELVENLKTRGVADEDLPAPPEEPKFKQLLTKGDLIIPAYKNNELRTFQYINENSYFSKKQNKTVNENFKGFVSKGEKKGSMHVIGELENGKGVALCEGWATGKAIHDNFGVPVVVAWDANNLINVAPVVRENLPDSRIYVFADNDWQKAVTKLIEKEVDTYLNTGLDQAWRTSREVSNTFVITPDFNKGINPKSLPTNPNFDIKTFSIKQGDKAYQLNLGSDWQDLIQNQGVEIAKAQFLEQLKEINRKHPMVATPNTPASPQSQKVVSVRTTPSTNINNPTR